MSLVHRKKNIEWSDDSWNPITGCPGPDVRTTPLDEEGHCEGCFAKFIALNRLRGRFGYDKDAPFKLTWHEDKLTLPLERKKPTIWFAFSMGEWLAAPAGWRQRALQIMLLAEKHIFATLTKQYDKLHLIKEDMQQLRYRYGKGPHDILHQLAVDSVLGDIRIPPNIWIGVSICYRNQLDGLDKLRKLDAPLKFGCFEPTMEDLSDADLTGLDWIIIGGRTRQGRFPAFIPEREWVEGLVHNARKLGIPVFLKPNLKYIEAGWYPKPIEEMPFDRIGGWPK